MDKKLYIVYWTHDDGMDEHEEVALLTLEQASVIEDRLYNLGAINYGVTDVLANAQPFEDVMATINEDIPQA